MRKNFKANPWFYPLPVIIIGTYDENNSPNAMNAAWGGIVDYDKVQLNMTADHKTSLNMKATNAFTLSFGTKSTVAACDYVGIVSGNDVENKFQKAGFTATKSDVVNAPIINELPMTLECEIVKYSVEGNDLTVIGKIVNISADESILTNGTIDYKKMECITYDPVTHNYVELGNSVAKAFNIGKTLK